MLLWILAIFLPLAETSESLLFFQFSIPSVGMTLRVVAASVFNGDGKVLVAAAAAARLLSVVGARATSEVRG